MPVMICGSSSTLCCLVLVGMLLRVAAPEYSTVRALWQVRISKWQSNNALNVSCATADKHCAHRAAIRS